MKIVCMIVVGIIFTTFLFFVIWVPEDRIAATIIGTILTLGTAFYCLLEETPSNNNPVVSSSKKDNKYSEYNDILDL